MDEAQVEGFVAAAERDYDAMVRVYRALVTGPVGLDVDGVREARADVLAAQQVLELARREEWRARQQREERQRAEEERVRREQPHAGGCEHCGAPGEVRAWGDLVPVDLCAACQELASGTATEGQADGR